ncbi:hypothetical protein L3X38_021560 [Prunus dulcis]|uniref:F-box family protein with DUF295 n=1 Tax=Prunus dulcis TaxID=3755 RepID=A0AAD4Z3R6_PRUDU|nr:hypothetical protein L3X38_021560 [Prunus dulcis]
MSTDIQFTLSFVSALDICLTSFRDARTDLRLGLTWCPETCQDLRLELTLCHRDLSGLRIRLTTVPESCQLRLGLTVCHRDLPADQADYGPLNPVSLRLG